MIESNLIKKFCLVFLILTLTMAIPSLASDPIKVVASTTLLEDLALEVGGDNVEVSSIVSSAVCPGHWDLSPSQLQKVITADVIIKHGMEEWLTTHVTTDQKVVTLSGAWNTPELAKNKTIEIAKVLGEIDPENKSYYDERASNYTNRMDQLTKYLENKAIEKNTSNIKVLCMEWHTNLVSWLGFDIVKSYGSEETLSMKDVNELISAGKDAGVSLVIDNLQSGTETGSMIAEEINATHIILTNFPGAVPGTETQEKVLKYNGDLLLDSI